MNLLDTIAPKSDQLNADDLIAGPKNITITRVTVAPGEQPVSIYFDGDGGKPYKPGKSMRRVLVKLYDNKAENLVGQSLTLFLDTAVKWAGQAVGGIRISHATGIQAPLTMALTENKGARKLFTVKPLIVKTYDTELKTLTDCITLDQLKAAFSALSPAAQKALGAEKDRLKTTLT